MILFGIFSNNFQELPDLLKFCPNYLTSVFSKEMDLNQNTFSKRKVVRVENSSSIS
jgi:hypothetical protein